MTTFGQAAEPKARLEDMDDNHVEVDLLSQLPPVLYNSSPSARTRSCRSSVSRPTTTGWSRSGAATPAAD